MSDQSLREALKELADERDSISGHAASDYHVQPYELYELLAAHPAELAPDCPQTAEEEPHGPHQVATLEEGVWWDCPGFGAAGSRPLLDREAVESVLRPALVENQVRTLTDAVMELARPMPTIDEVAYALFEHDSETTGRATPWGELGAIMKATYLDRGEAVLAMLNGAES